MKRIKLKISSIVVCITVFLLLTAGVIAGLTLRSYRDPVVTEVSIESSKATTSTAPSAGRCRPST